MARETRDRGIAEAHDEALAAIRAHAHPLAPDYAPLFDRLAQARFVLLGEASHGTHEFYDQRAELTKRLIVERHLDAIAVEADWPDAYRVNRYVRGLGDDADASEALRGFERFPGWMWRNTVVRDFIGWLRRYNDGVPIERRVGFYGLDLYSLSASIDAVLEYLDRVDPQAAQRARQRYSCFDHFRENVQGYGYAASFGLDASCEQAVVQQLVDLTRKRVDYLRGDGRDEADAFFHAEQNARLVRDAEAYYRTMFGARISSWNLRDRHMVDTLQALDAHLARRGSPPRIAVWAHNSHLGDARATEMGERSEWNVGQLVREQYGANETMLVGFSTYQGTVTAASDWGGHAERKTVRPGLPGSFEALFHEAGPERFLLLLREPRLARALRGWRLQRAIGVIYRPQSERASHYLRTRLPAQFDAMIHLDRTCALEPLEPGARWHDEEPPETWPSGL